MKSPLLICRVFPQNYECGNKKIFFKWLWEYFNKWRAAGKGIFSKCAPLLVWNLLVWGTHSSALPKKSSCLQINEVRKLLKTVPDKLSTYCSDASIARHLRARNWNVKKATKMLKDTLKWRSEYKPEEIRWVCYHSWPYRKRIQEQNVLDFTFFFCLGHVPSL